MKNMFAQSVVMYMILKLVIQTQELLQAQLLKIFRMIGLARNAE